MGANTGIVIIPIISTVPAITYLKIHDIIGITINFLISFAENHSKKPRKISIIPDADEKKTELGTLRTLKMESINKKDIPNPISNHPLNFKNFNKKLSLINCNRLIHEHLIYHSNLV